VFHVKDGNPTLLQSSVKKITVWLLKIAAPEMKQKTGLKTIVL